ncbi:unnamed protein product [Cuscuta epithymum]|uniref:Uncharacterized protein n=1 Tax=Cuscuta epithymum TaxID=186058 RepID=A0AAV0F884_9ASTE|nr:unnamed protein product [Cuscuta epithymum]
MPPTLTPDRPVGLRRSGRNMKASPNLIRGSSVVSIEDSDQESETSKAGAGDNADVFTPMQVVFPVGEASLPAPNKCPPVSTAATSSSSSRLAPSAHELLALASKKKRASPRLASTPQKLPKLSVVIETKPNLPRPYEVKTVPALKPLDVKMSLSPDFCSLRDVSLMRGEVHKLMLPSSPDVFKGLPPAGLLSASSAYAFQVNLAFLSSYFVSSLLM